MAEAACATLQNSHSILIALPLGTGVIIVGSFITVLLVPFGLTFWSRLATFLWLFIGGRY